MKFTFLLIVLLLGPKIVFGKEIISQILIQYSPNAKGFVVSKVEISEGIVNETFEIYQVEGDDTIVYTLPEGYYFRCWMSNDDILCIAKEENKIYKYNFIRNTFDILYIDQKFDNVLTRFYVNSKNNIIFCLTKDRDHLFINHLDSTITENKISLSSCFQMDSSSTIEDFDFCPQQSLLALFVMSNKKSYVYLYDIKRKRIVKCIDIFNNKNINSIVRFDLDGSFVLYNKKTLFSQTVIAYPINQKQSEFKLKIDKDINIVNINYTYKKRKNIILSYSTKEAKAKRLPPVRDFTELLIATALSGFKWKIFTL